QGQARVSRVFETDAPAGAHTLVFRNLPTGVDISSIQLEIAEGNVRLGGVQVDREFTVADESGRLKELRSQLETLELEKAARQRDRKLAEDYAAHHRELLAAIRDGIRETGDAALYGLGRDAWASSAEAQREAFEEIRALDEQIKELDRNIPDARRRYQERL